MVVVEFGNEDFGKIMKYITCIEDKTMCLKEMISNSMTRERKRSYDEDDDEEEWSRHKSDYRKGMNRYV